LLLKANWFSNGVGHSDANWRYPMTIDPFMMNHVTMGTTKIVLSNWTFKSTHRLTKVLNTISSGLDLVHRTNFDWKCLLVNIFLSIRVRSCWCYAFLMFVSTLTYGTRTPIHECVFDIEVVMFMGWGTSAH
jgi:hypothetical protein